jgi:hypothetical protein
VISLNIIIASKVADKPKGIKYFTFKSKYYLITIREAIGASEE